MNSPLYNPQGGPGGPAMPGPSQNQKLMAAAAHASILLPHAGLLVPLVLWLMNSSGESNGSGSRFVAFQARQAFFFHLSTAALEWLVVITGFVLGFLTLGLGWMAIWPLVALGHLAAVAYGIVGAVKTFEGRDFRYPVLGRILQP